MSYCRFSSNNFRCDAYCYQSVSGSYMLHLANNRIVDEVPDFPDMLLPSKEFQEQYTTYEKFFETCERIEIDLPYAGESFEFATLEELKDKLVELKDIGYRFPDTVLFTIEEELMESNKNES